MDRERLFPEKPATTAVAIHPLLARRWSGRAFDPARPVSRADQRALIEAARWAPSSTNWQPWRLVLWERAVDAASWQRACAALDAGNRAWAERAPLLIAMCADGLDRRDRPNAWALHDVGLATQNLLLQAAALGLMAHPMAGYDPAALRVAAAIPERFIPAAMIAVGDDEYDNVFIVTVPRFGAASTLRLRDR